MEDSAKEPEQTLQSFASLLSSALTTGGTVPLTGCASAISCFFSQVDSTETCVSIPSLSLKNRSGVKSPSAFGSSKRNLEESAAFSLSVPLLCTKEDVVAAPTLVLQNVLQSFDSLINSRLRSSLIALVRQTNHNQKISRIIKTDGDPDLAARRAKIILNLFSSSMKAISMNTIVTSFRVLPMDGDRDSSNGCSDLILPLVFEAIVDVKILGQIVTVALRAPGTIRGSFRQSNDETNEEGRCAESQLCLDGVQIAFDTSTLLKSMMKQARIVVKKAMLAANGVAEMLASDSGKQFLMDPSVPIKDKVSLTKQSGQYACAKKSDEENSSANKKTDNANAPLKDPPASAMTHEDDSASSRHFTPSRTGGDKSHDTAVLTRRASCPLMPPPPPRPPSCGSNTSSTSSGLCSLNEAASLCSLNEAATLVSGKPNASFGDLQSQTFSTSMNANDSRQRTTPIVSLENLARQTKLERKSSKKRSKLAKPQLYSLARKEEHDGNGKANEEWQTGTPKVSSDNLRILPHKKRRMSSCPDFVY